MAFSRAESHGARPNVRLAYPRLVVPPAPPDAGIGEAAFQRLITDLMDVAGWLWHHEKDSRRSKRGFPDLVAIKPGRPIVIWEVKTQRGRVRREQQVWLNHLSWAPGVEAGVVRPADWAYVLAVLCGEEGEECHWTTGGQA